MMRSAEELLLTAQQLLVDLDCANYIIITKFCDHQPWRGSIFRNPGSRHPHLHFLLIQIAREFKRDTTFRWIEISTDVEMMIQLAKNRNKIGNLLTQHQQRPNEIKSNRMSCNTRHNLSHTHSSLSPPWSCSSGQAIGYLLTSISLAVIFSGGGEYLVT